MSRLLPSVRLTAPVLGAALIASTLTGGSELLAQRVLGPTLDATVLPRGMLRVAVGPEWGRGHERYASGRGRSPRGTVEPLAAPFIRDTLGAALFPALTAVETGVRDIVGGTAPLPLSLGPLAARFDATVARTPIVVELGVTRRLTVGAVIPLVRSWTEVSLEPNRSRRDGTVGLNPAYRVAAARSANQLVVTQLQAAGTALAQLLTQCAGSAAPTCAAINADRAAAQALVADAARAATGIETVYGTSTVRPGNRFVPTDSAAVQRAIAQRLSTLSGAFAGFLGAAPGGTGWVSARPVGAAPFSYGDLQRTLVDTAYGIGADSLISVELERLGDVELGARFLLYDGVGGTPQRARPSGVRLRVAVEGLVRFGTGVRDSLTHFADLGSGDGQRDLEGRILADLLVGRRAWATVAARYAVQQADQVRLRVPRFADDPFPPASRTALLGRDLGDLVGFEVSPRYVVSDELGVSASWQFTSKGSDRYTGSGLGTEVLEAGSGQQLQRGMVALTYSTLARYYQRQSRIPMEVSLSFGRTLGGAGNTLKQSLTSLTLRVYNQLLEGSR